MFPRLCLIFLALPASLFSQEVNFGRTNTIGSFMPARELQVWANQRKLVLQPDCALRDLKDDEAEIIPAEGAMFELPKPRGDRKVYLYLDLVTFRPFQEEPSDCIPKLKWQRLGGLTELPATRWLEVKVNGSPVALLYQGSGTLINSPIIIPLDREKVTGKVIQVELRPSPGDGVFALWDAFVSHVYEADQE